jgi:hypothetical protein
VPRHTEIGPGGLTIFVIVSLAFSILLCLCLRVLDIPRNVLGKAIHNLGVFTENAK